MQLENAYKDFLSRYPGYLKTAALDALRATEYRRLDDERHVYLDYTGGSLYAESQLRQHADMLRSGVFGNPHSVNPASAAMTEHVERTRRHILRYFNANPDEYIAIFTLNASGALKLVGESYPFSSASRYLLTFDNHNSVNGIREFARAKGATVDYVPLSTPELRLNRARIASLLDHADRAQNNLFAYPAQSNFSGVKHPLDLVAEAQSKGWDVLLDSAAFVPTNRLDLGAVRPDFVTVSFYKMFGYPTGVGVLLARRPALAKLRRPWFGGGTVNFVSVQARTHELASNEAAFEDGTLNYLSIPAVETGLRHIEAVGLETINERVRCLTGWLLDQLVALRHTNGRPMVRVYGPVSTYCRGGTITLNLYDPEGHLLDYRRVEELAKDERISFRTGCFCNPGAGEMAEGITKEEIQGAIDEGPGVTLQTIQKFLQQRGHKSAGSIRVSFGLASNFADAYRFREFIATFRDQSRLSIGEVTFDIAACRHTREGT
jgi:molybdenum cofactor sulfurtransferase